MSKKIKDVSESIKSKLSFDDYTPSSPLQIDLMQECHKAIKPERQKSNKVKRTFYILESVADKLDEVYAKKLTEKKKVDKSDIVTQALTNLFMNEENEIQMF